jgi:exonuclease VII large subunit
MSRVEILKKIRNLEQAIQNRSKRLTQLEAMDDPEALLESIKIRNELELLNNERSRLVEQAETLKNSLQEKLSALEREYLDAVEREKAAIKKLYNMCKNLQTQIREVREIANDTHMKFIPYKNHCDELGIPAKSLHLLEVPHISQLTRWLANFTDWVEKTRWAE